MVSPYTMWSRAIKGLFPLLVMLLPATVQAQGKDIVQVTNGDRFTGNVSRLAHGELDFSTAAAGTIPITWMEVTRLTSSRHFDIELASGERLSGSISSPADGRIVVQRASGPTAPIDLKDIIGILPVEAGFRNRTVGSIDFGLNFTNAHDARTYTLDAEATHYSAARTFETQVTFNSWLSARDDAERQTRNNLTGDVRRRLPRRWFAVAIAEAQQDEELDLDLRLLTGGGIGRALVQTNRGVLALDGGLDYAAERYSGTGTFDHTAEAFAGVDANWFASGSITEADLTAKTFFSLQRQRVRVELDGTIRRDIWRRMYWALNTSESFDSDPPSDRNRSDLGVSFTLGWAF
jgi:hypothetical protein